MAWQGLSGQALSLQEAETLTEFEADQQTWPFAGMLAFANAGYLVRSIEDFMPQPFVDNPAAEIKRQSDSEEVTAHVLEVSDVERQRKLVADCLATPAISFEVRIPDINDLRRMVSQEQTAVICNVNYKALVGESGYNGHFVLVEAIGIDSVLLQNPGLPPIKDQRVSLNRFISAWCEPSRSMANILAVTKAPG